jgi:ribosome-binding factor A
MFFYFIQRDLPFNPSMIMETKRQKQVAKMIQQTLSEILTIKGREITGEAFVTISNVKMTPDLLVARVYLSIFNAKDQEEIMKQFEAHYKALRRALGDKVRHQLRRVPHLEFFKDDTLDEVFRLEQIFKELKEKEKGAADKDLPEAE